MKKIENKVKSEVTKQIKQLPIVRHPGATVGRAAQSLGVPHAALVGSAIGKIIGTGDYRIVGPQQKQSAQRGATVASFTQRDFGCIVTHREYVGDVVASSTAGAFQNTSYPINPGMSTFPWLKTLAPMYDQWQPIGIVVQYVPTSSTYSGTSSLGTVSVAADYDVLDDAYTNRLEMNNSDGAVTANAAMPITFGLECKSGQTPLKAYYTRVGTPSSTTDSLRYYDLANLQVATFGCTASQVCGELWISYKIRFLKPQIPRFLPDVGDLKWSSGATGASPFGGTLSNLSSYNTSGITTSGATITFDKSLRGRAYEFCYFAIGNSTACTWLGAATTSGCSTLTLQYDTASYLGTLATTTCFMMVFGVVVNDALETNATYQITGLTIPAVSTSSGLSWRQVRNQTLY